MEKKIRKACIGSQLKNQHRIGGYRVCEKWLKDRKGRTLSLNEIIHYCKIVTAIEQTIKIQKDIDMIFGDIEEAILR